MGELILSEKSEIVSQESSTVLWSTLGCPCGHKTDEISAPDPNIGGGWTLQLRGVTCSVSLSLSLSLLLTMEVMTHHLSPPPRLKGPNCANIIYRA